jgi:hypothetical protein
MPKKHGALPEVVEKDEFEIKQIIAAIKASTLSEDVKNFVIKCIELSLWIPVFLQKKNVSLHRLRLIIFGKGYGKRNKNMPPNNGEVENTPIDAASDTELTEGTLPPVSQNNSESKPTSLTMITASSIIVEEVIENIVLHTDDTTVDGKNKKPGHGRMPHTIYENCIDTQLLLDLTAGDNCPMLCGGRLGTYAAGVIVRIKGQNFAQIYRYAVDKLRCGTCGIIIEASIPPEVGTEKYDASFKAMLAILKYYVGVPFYRQENFQKMLGFPLSDSTQWMLIEKLAGFCYAIYNKLKYYAANSKVVQNDDTTLRILEVIKDIKNGTSGERTGMYTTGVVAEYEGHKIALFINGRQHSGENINDILKLREVDKEPIIQMCDALPANIPKDTATIVANCLSHGFRKFVEIVDFYQDMCPTIIEKLSQVFKYDAESQTMSDDARLKYHQEHSQPVMFELKKYMASLLDEHLVEPNSPLGKSIKYMQKNWEKLTRFLTVAGTPIDNNIVERALKIAIRNRKSAMFYKTSYSAGIGGMLTSLIYTCDLNQQNPQDYLVALQTHQAAVLDNPGQWMPWNYLEAINLVTSANPQVHSPPVDLPAVA